MAVPKSEAFLVQNTGIGQGQYMWWESKDACDSWFAGKKSGVPISNYSRIYGEAQSANKHNVACVNVAAPLNKTMDCDYFAYKNSDEGRWFYAAITGREFVSDNATRLHFAIDFVATYFDCLKFKNCFIERMTGEEAVYTNLLPEPISVQIIEYPLAEGESGAAAIDDVNMEFADLKFVVCTDMDMDGKVNEPQCNFVSGFAYGGYIKICSSVAEVAEQVKGRIKWARSLIAKTTSTASTVSSIIACPTKCAVLGKKQTYENITLTAPTQGKWNKTKNYQYLRLMSGSGQSIELKPTNFGKASFSMEVIYAGGLDGCIRIQNTYCPAMGVNSPTWGQISFGGTAADGNNAIAPMSQYIDKAKRVMGDM